MNHDQNFKNLILDYPRQALALFAESEAAEVAAKGCRITPIRQEQLKERLGERFRELDVPLLVEWSDGRRAAILFVLEEETHPGRFSIHRLAHYALDLSELFQTDRVVPVVIFLRDGNPATELLLGSEMQLYLQFRYLSRSLASLDYDAYRESDNIVARLNLPNMRYQSGRKVEVYAQAMRGLLQLETDLEKQLKYIDYIDIYAQLTEDQQRQYQRDYPEEANQMSKFAERFIEQGVHEGMQQGMQQGMQEGMQKGEAMLLQRLLRMKFGDLPESVLQRLEHAEQQQLLEWSDRVLVAKTLDEIFQ